MTASSQTLPTNADESRDFSVILGGPLYQLFCKAHLCGHVLELLKRRVLVLCGIAWLPLLAFTILEGNAWNPSIKVPFLIDIEDYVRFLVALPLFVVAELVVHERMRLVVRQFLERGLIPDNERPRFDAAIAAALRLRNSIRAELILIAIVYVLGVYLMWQGPISLNAVSWEGTFGRGELHPTLAGLWFRCVSLPLLQFLLLRWYFRIFIWTRFLWQVSRLHLNLIPAHPDRSAGLGFLTLISYAFTPLLLAQGALVAGVIADRIIYTGARLPQFKVEIIVLVVVAFLMVVGPLLSFVGRLSQLKRVALLEYGALAQRYTREFDQKWLHGSAPPDEPLLGSGDIQSLADLGNSFEVIKQIKVIPFTPRALVQLVVVALVPIAPLLLTMLSPEELLQRLMRVVF